MNGDTFNIEFGSNPKLAEYFARKSPGDECRLTLTMRVKEKRKDSVGGLLSKVEIHESSYQPEETDVTIGADAPASVMLKAINAK